MLTIATGHEDPTKAQSTIDWGKLADPHRTLVLLMAMGNLANICARLIGARAFREHAGCRYRRWDAPDAAHRDRNA